MGDTVEKYIIDVAIRSNDTAFNSMKRVIDEQNKSLEFLKRQLKDAGVSSQQLASAQQQAAVGMNGFTDASKKASSSFGNMNQIIQNSSFQVTDFVVSIQNGQSALKAFGQQAPQFLGVFGPMGALAGLVAGLGAAAIGLGSSMKTASKDSDTLSKSFEVLNAMGEKSITMSNDAAKAFNKMGKDAQAAAISMAKVTMAESVHNYVASVKEAREKAEQLYSQQMKVAEVMQIINKHGEDFQNLAQTGSYLDPFAGIQEGEAVAKRLQIQLDKLKKQLGLFDDKDALKVAGVLQQLRDGSITAAQALTQLQETLQYTPQGVEFLSGLVKQAGNAEKALQAVRVTADLLTEMKSGHVTTDEDEKNLKELEKLQRNYAKSVAENNAELLTNAFALTEVKKTEIQQLEELLGKYNHLDENVREYVQAQIDLAKATEEAVYWSDLMIGAGQRYVDMEAVSSEAMQKEADRLENLRDKYLGIINPQNKLQDSYHELFTIANEGLITWDEYAEALKKVEEKSNKLNDSMEAFGKHLAESIGGAVDDIITSFGQANKSFGDFAEAFIKDIARMISQLLIFQPLAKSMKEWFGGFNSPGDFFGSLFANAKGRSFGNLGLPQGVYTQPMAFPMVGTQPKAFAHGGTFGVMAERGAEAIVPLKRTVNGDLGVKSSPVIVNVNNSTQAEVSVQQTQGPDGATMLNIMVEKKVRELLGKGSLDRQMQVHYGLSRQPA